MTQPEAGITVTTKFFPLAFILFFLKPHVVIDGYDSGGLSWGDYQTPVRAGRHHVRVFCPYLFLSEMGANEMVVDVLPGQVVHIRWYAPLIVFMKGSMTYQGVSALPGAAAPSDHHAVAPVVPAPATPAPAPTPAGPAAGWHPDPTGRHQHRYWNGTTWTDDVAGGGVATKDAVGA